MRSYLLVVGLAFSLPANAALKNESEAGVVVTNGNSRTQSYSVKNKSTYTFEQNSVVFSGNWLTATNQGVQSAESWMLALRYERSLSEKTSLFLQQSVEGDKFAGVLQRYNSDLGVKQYFYKTEKDFLWFAEGGYRFTKENTSKGTKENFHKARLYTEAEKFFNESVSSKLWIEFIPNFTLTRSWLLNSELSLSAAMNAVFALKAGILLRYNNLPPVATAQKADTTFTTALTAKF
jgi:putative salt-induced outer membrane protein